MSISQARKRPRSQSPGASRRRQIARTSANHVGVLTELPLSDQRVCRQDPQLSASPIPSIQYLDRKPTGKTVLSEFPISTKDALKTGDLKTGLPSAVRQSGRAPSRGTSFRFGTSTSRVLQPGHSGITEKLGALGQECTYSSINGAELNVGDQFTEHNEVLEERHAIDDRFTPATTPSSTAGGATPPSRMSYSDDGVLSLSQEHLDVCARAAEASARLHIIEDAVPEAAQSTKVLQVKAIKAELGLMAKELDEAKQKLQSKTIQLEETSVELANLRKSKDAWEEYYYHEYEDHTRSCRRYRTTEAALRSCEETVRKLQDKVQTSQQKQQNLEEESTRPRRKCQFASERKSDAQAMDVCKDLKFRGLVYVEHYSGDKHKLRPGVYGGFEYTIQSGAQLWIATIQTNCETGVSSMHRRDQKRCRQFASKEKLSTIPPTQRDKYFILEEENDETLLDSSFVYAGNEWLKVSLNEVKRVAKGARVDKDDWYENILKDRSDVPPEIRRVIADRDAGVNWSYKNKTVGALLRDLEDHL